MITVYYSSYDIRNNLYTFCNEPVPVNKDLIKNVELDKEEEIFRCPAIKAFNYNLFQITSTYDYQFVWNGQEVISNMHNQEYFDNYIQVRNIEKGLISYIEPRIFFFTDYNKLDMSLLPVIYKKNSINAITIPGTFDIANHFRHLELAMIFNSHQTVCINAGDPLYYVKFHTDKKIKFVRFELTDTLLKLSSSLLQYRRYAKKVVPLSWYYNVVQKFYKKRYLKLIKENLLE